MEQFVHLRCHSHYSLLSGTDTIESLVKACRERGMSALALTDTDAFYGAVAFYREATKEGIKPIIGVELTEKKTGQDHAPIKKLLLLAKNMAGYSQLCRLVTARQLEDNFSLLEALFHTQFDNLFILSQDEEILRALVDHAAPGHFYVELNYFGDRESGRKRRELTHLAKRLNLPAVATNDVHFVDPDGYETHRVLAAIGANATVTTTPSWLLASSQSWLTPPEVMVKLFAEFPEALENSRKIAEQCHWELELGKPKFPDFSPPAPHTPASYLRKLALTGLKKRYPALYLPLRRCISESERILDRLEYELKIILDLKFATYFLIVWDIVRYARRQGIPTIGRGSAANSLVCYSLGITHVDPLQYNLYFERFLNPDRADCPDIDLDFPWNRRDEILHYVYEKYGHDHVAMISTFVRFRGRSTIREIGKALGTPKTTIDRFVSRIPHFSDVSHLEKIREVIPECRGLPLEEEPYKSIIKLGQKIEGYPRHLSIHCGGIVISPGPITNLVPLEKAGKGLVISQFDMYPVEDLGLVKIDLLGQRSLAVLVDTLEAVKKNYGLTVDFTRLDPISDTATRRLMETGETMGCFYIESPGMRNLLKKLRVNSFETLVAASSIIRPGVSSSGMMKAFINRYKGKEKIIYLHPRLEEVLKETFGVMVYQEDVMKVASAVAGMTLAEADSLRKCMSKKRGWEAMENYRRRFLSGAETNGVKAEVAKEIWRQIESFGGYAFCKAHSASFAQLSYQVAFLKAHFPAEFMAAVISNQGGFYHAAAYIEEARRMGLKILLPHINHSVLVYQAEKVEPSYSLFYEGRETRDEGRGNDLPFANRPSSFFNRPSLIKKGIRRNFLYLHIPSPSRKPKAEISNFPAIRIGLMQVKGLTSASIESVLEARKEGAFSSLTDFCRRSQVTYHEIRSLILCGAMDCFGLTRPHLLWQLEIFKAEGKVALDQVIPTHPDPLPSRGEETKETSRYFFDIPSLPQSVREGQDEGRFSDETLANLAIPDFSWQEKLQLEEEFLDFPVTAHPLVLYRQLWEGKGAIEAKELGRYAGKRVKLAGWIITSQRTRTVKGEYMKFVTMEDLTASYEVTFFPKAYRRCGQVLLNGQGPYLVSGLVEDDGGCLTLTADSLTFLIKKNKTR